MEEKKKSKGGRPSKYKPEYCEQLKELFKEGYDFRSACGKLGINQTTGDRWCKRYPEFCLAKKEGKDMSYAFFIEKGLANLSDKGFNTTLWYMMMKNMHGWRDKHEQEIRLGEEKDNKLIIKLEKQ